MRKIYFITRPCHPFADPYHDGHAWISIHIPLKEFPFQVVDNIRIHCAPTKDPKIVYSTEVKTMEFEVDLS